MDERPERGLIRAGGNSAFVGWLGLLTLIAGLAFLGRGTAEPTPLSIEPEIGVELSLTGPRPDTRFSGNGTVTAGARVSPPTRTLEFEVRVDGVTIGSIAMIPDAGGAALARIPILPPAGGGRATITVRDAIRRDVESSVDVVLDPADPLVVWSPLAWAFTLDAAATGLNVFGFVQPAVDALGVDVQSWRGQLLAAARGSVAGWEVPAPAPQWHGFSVWLSLPTGWPGPCVYLSVTALGPDGETISSAQLPSADC